MSDGTGFDELDELTAHDLRSRGSLKWTRFGEGAPAGPDDGGDTIGAVVAEMDFGTAPAVTSALRAAVESSTFGYLPPRLASELANACAHWQRERYGWQVPPEQIFPVADVLTALELVMRHVARPGSPVIVPTPAYMPFLTLPPLHGREVVQVPMAPDGGRYVLDLAGIDQAFRNGAHLLQLCNPVNPVGRVFTAAELAGVTEVVDRHGGLVFADEVHGPLVFPGHAHLPYAATSPTAAEHTVTAVSASKAWNIAGLRCAQVILAPGQLDRWRTVGATGPVLPSTLGAIATEAAYRAGGHWLDRVLAYLDRNRRVLGELVAEHLPGVGYYPPEGTYLAWWDCRGLEVPGRLDAFFRERAGVAVLEGADCGRAGEGHVRFNFAMPLPILQRAVTRVAHAWVHGHRG